HYSDNAFHNVGAGVEELTREPSRLGRFAVAPLGEKQRHLKGAYKTPTLRALLRTAPYFHNGEKSDLESALALHIDRAPPKTPFNFYLDPKLADKDGGRRDFGLTPEERGALVLFLRALNGDDADSFLTAAR